MVSLGPCKVSINPSRMIYTRQRIEGILSNDYMRTNEYLPYLSRLIREKKLIIDETFFHGIESWGKAFTSTMVGTHVGKVVVMLGEDDQ